MPSSNRKPLPKIPTSSTTNNIPSAASINNNNNNRRNLPVPPTAAQARRDTYTAATATTHSNSSPQNRNLSIDSWSSAAGGDISPTSTNRSNITPMEQRIQQKAAKLFLLRSQEAKQWIEEFLGMHIHNCADHVKTSSSPQASLGSDSSAWDNDTSTDTKESSSDLVDHLRDGELLLRLVEPFCHENEKPQIHRNIDPNSRMAFMKATDNIQQFQQICLHKLNLPSIYMFSISDLWERKNVTSVVHCVHALAHFLEKQGYLDRLGLPKLRRIENDGALLDQDEHTHRFNPLLLRRIEEEFRKMDADNINMHSLEFGFDEMDGELEARLENLNINASDREKVHFPSCRVEALNSHMLHLGDTLHLRVQLRNQFGEPLEHVQQLHSATVAAVRHLPSDETIMQNLSLKNMGNGRFDLSLHTGGDSEFIRAGTGDYEILCHIDGEPIAPLRVKLHSGKPSALHTEIVDDFGLTTDHFEGYLYNFTVQVKDEFNQIVRDDKLVKLSPMLTYLMNNSRLHVKYSTHTAYKGNGLFQINFLTPLPGNYELNLFLNDNMEHPVTRFPFNFSVYKLEDPGVTFQEFLHQGSSGTAERRAVLQGEALLISHQQESSPIYVSVIANQTMAREALTPQEHHLLQDTLGDYVKKWVSTARSEAFQYYLNPKTIDPNFDDEQLLLLDGLNAGDTLWRMIEQFVPDREDVLLHALQDSHFLADNIYNSATGQSNQVQRVVFDMEPRDWSDYEQMMRGQEEEIGANAAKRDSLNQFSLSNNESDLVYDPLHPRMCSLSFWMWVSQKIEEAKRSGTPTILDLEQKIHSYKISELYLREFSDVSTFNFCRKADIKRYGELQLNIAQRMVFEMIDEMKQQLGSSFPNVQGLLMARGKQVFSLFKENHELFLTVLTRTDYLGDCPLNGEVTRDIKNNAKLLISALRREYLKQLQDTVEWMRKEVLMGDILCYSDSDANKLLFSTQFLKTKLSDLWSAWEAMSRKMLSQSPRRILVQHLLFPLPPNTMQAVKHTSAYSVQVPLNCYFDSTIESKTNLSTKDRNGPGLVNPWKVAFLKNNSVVFEAVRSGCLSPSGIQTNSTLRKNASLKNAQDLLRYVAMNHAKRFTREELSQLNTNRKALEIPFTSLSLMTPFFLPDREDRIALEHAQCLLQTFDSNQVSDILVDMHDQKAPVRVAVKYSKPCLVNFGTNIAMKTFKRGLVFQRMINCRKFGMRRFELKVNQFLHDVGRKKRALREEILSWLSQNYFSNSREAAVYKQAIDDRTFNIERCYVLREKKRQDLSKKIHLLDTEIFQLQQKLEDMISKHVLPNMENVTQLEIVSKWKISGLVNQILKHHHEIYKLESQYHDMEEQVVWEDQFIKELKVMFNHRTVSVNADFEEYVDLSQREMDIWNLYREVRHIYHNYQHEEFAQGVFESEDVKRVDPYSISVRIALITFSLGEQLHFNCKSGGSRTGELHDQILEYCEWRFQFGEYPASKKAHKTFNDHRRTIHSIVALNGCTQELHEINTGAPGSGADKSISGRFLPGLYSKYRGLAGFDNLTYTNYFFGADKEIKRFRKMAEAAL